MESKACSDTGPILHLHEIDKVSLLNVFDKIFISAYIKEELLKYKIESLANNFELKEVNKDQAALLAEKYVLEIGEASVVWLCKCLKVPLLLTDDLIAREVVMQLGIRPVGAVGVILRCFREKIVTQEHAIEILKLLHKKSSLFITSALINYAIGEVNRFKKA